VSSRLATPTVLRGEINIFEASDSEVDCVRVHHLTGAAVPWQSDVELNVDRCAGTVLRGVTIDHLEPIRDLERGG
jgi:hypothetical protein